MELEEFKAIMALVMFSDPCPVNPITENQIISFLNRKSKEMGFIDWIEAYHKL